MKTTIILLLLTVTFLNAQINFRGNISSSFYSFENPADNENQLNQYYGLNFKINPQDNQNLYFKGNIKAIYDGSPQDWREKVYNAYFSWKTPFKNTSLQLGRQFYYAGVINGTLDAVAVSINPVDKLKLKVIGGAVAPVDRSLEFDEDNGTAFGGFGSYSINKMVKLNASYFQKQRNEETYWQQLGTAVSGNWDQLYYILKYDHNLITAEYQSILLNAFYRYNAWSFTGEVSSQKPRVYEDSFFSIFKLKEYNQFRLAVTRAIFAYEIGLQVIHTMYQESESTQHLIFTFGNNWGTLGLVYQTGFAGENIGLYADINYHLLENLRFILRSSYYQYERQSVDVEEDATSFSAGIRYNPIKSLAVNIQMQESINSYYKSDLRGLLKLAYSFSY